jgi:cell division transport system permease protein
LSGILVAGRRFDLPLDSTAASRFLPWIIASMIYLAVVLLGIAAIADGALNTYSMRARLVTVTIPAAEDPAAGERDVARALDHLDGVPGVTSATPVADEELKDLIEPWLGDATGSSELPLPRLIDVTFDATAELDLAELQRELREVAPGATLGIEAVSRNRAERLATFSRAWAGVLGVLMMLAILVVVAWITRLSLDLHQQTVELLRFMGAPDGYVARQFERHALLNAVKGGIVGFVLAVVTLLLLLGTGRWMELGAAIELTLRPVDWILLACVPIVIVLMITAAVRMTALWGLGRMP